MPRASAEAENRPRQVSRSSSGSGAAPASGRSARTTSGPRSRLRSGPGIAPALQVAAPTTCKHEGRWTRRRAPSPAAGAPGGPGARWAIRRSTAAPGARPPPPPRRTRRAPGCRPAGRRLQRGGRTGRAPRARSRTEGSGRRAPRRHGERDRRQRDPGDRGRRRRQRRGQRGHRRGPRGRPGRPGAAGAGCPDRSSGRRRGRLVLRGRVPAAARAGQRPAFTGQDQRHQRHRPGPRRGARGPLARRLRRAHPHGALPRAPRTASRCSGSTCPAWR